MNSQMFQYPGGFADVVREKTKARLPEETAAKIRNLEGRFDALKQGSVGPTMSDLQFMMENERKQHQDAYNYAHGHNDGSAPLGTPSF